MIRDNVWPEVDQRKTDVDYLTPDRGLHPIQLLINNLEGFGQTYHTLNMDPLGGHSSICYHDLRLKLALAL